MRDSSIICSNRGKQGAEHYFGEGVLSVEFYVVGLWGIGFQARGRGKSALSVIELHTSPSYKVKSSRDALRIRGWRSITYPYVGHLSSNNPLGQQPTSARHATNSMPKELRPGAAAGLYIRTIVAQSSYKTRGCCRLRR